MLTLVCVSVYIARYTLIPFAVGGLIAYAMTPLIVRMIRLIPIRNPKHDAWRRGLAVMLIFLAFAAALTIGVLTLIPLAAEQIAHFIDNLPSIITSAQEQTVGLMQEYQRRTPPEIQERLARVGEQGAATIGQFVARFVQGTLSTLTSTVGFILGLAIMPFFMFYAMRDRQFVGPNLVNAAPAEVRDDVRMMLSLTDLLLGRYIRAQLFLGLVVGSAVGVLLGLLGVQLSLGLGVWAGVTELIPIVGPWLGAIPGLILVAATEPSLLPWVALVYFIVQQVENSLLVPRIQGDALDLHPAMVILLLVTGGAVFGFFGLVAIVPAAAIVREEFWYLDRRLRGMTPEEAYAASRVVRVTAEAEKKSAGAPAPAQPVEVTR